jgi:hypothetical protein
MVRNSRVKLLKSISRNRHNFVVYQKVYFCDKSFYILDTLFPFLNFGIEVDGLHHYLDEKQLPHDMIRDEYLRSKYKVDIIRVPNLVLEGSPLVELDRYKGFEHKDKQFKSFVQFVIKLITLKLDMMSHNFVLNKKKIKRRDLSLKVKTTRGSKVKIFEKMKRLDYIISVIQKSISQIEKEWDELIRQPAAKTYIDLSI